MGALVAGTALATAAPRSWLSDTPATWDLVLEAGGMLTDP